MTESERQLVETITQQVLEVLQRSGGVTRASGPSSTPATIAPPVGVCTGDYSKFPELAGRQVGAMRGGSGTTPSGASGAAASTKHTAAEPLPLTGIVTANQLQAAMDASADRVARLAADAKLTPLANDLARQFPQRIVRINREQSASASAMSGAPATWLWWADGACATVDGVVAARRDRLRAATAGRSSGALVQVIRDLAGAIQRHQVAGGVLFVASAAQAMCLANRCLNIRAVLGTCDEAVEQGVRELGANVLVIEYPSVGERSMAAMVDRFTAQLPQASAAMERILAELHRCG